MSSLTFVAINTETESKYDRKNKSAKAPKIAEINSIIKTTSQLPQSECTEIGWSYIRRHHLRRVSSSGASFKRILYQLHESHDYIDLVRQIFVFV